MKAIIKLDVPEWQIDQEVSVYFKDTMMKRGICEPEKTGMWIVLDECANEGIYCSECNHKIFDSPEKPKKKKSNYCPNCGSKNDQFYNPTTEKYMR
jgi:DNA-directed RNA polymerase subunit RPC12/RpoP